MAQASLSVPTIDISRARRIWLNAQRLDTPAPFGSGPQATRRAIEHLGYVQIDTINVIERCHHHILYSRIPDYRRADLHTAQSVDKTVFEYWTHALSYVPTRDLRYFLGAMKDRARQRSTWFGSVSARDLRRVIALVRDQGPLTIRDIDDEVLEEKNHPWASRKPSKRALQLAFYAGALTISARQGMVKSYELLDRHFDWAERPRPPSPKQVSEYVLDRALRAQGIVSLDSICHLDAARKPAIRQLIETRIRRRQIVPVSVKGLERVQLWTRPETLATDHRPTGEPVHILSPFDPLIIQRKRLSQFFDYEHRFEAYRPKNERIFGYFALPVLVGEEVVAAIDFKTDRRNSKLLIQKWTWMSARGRQELAGAVEDALHRFEQFQLGDLAR